MAMDFHSTWREHPLFWLRISIAGGSIPTATDRPKESLAPAFAAFSKASGTEVKSLPEHCPLTFVTRAPKNAPRLSRIWQKWPDGFVSTNVPERPETVPLTV